MKANESHKHCKKGLQFLRTAYLAHSEALLFQLQEKGHRTVYLLVY